MQNPINASLMSLPGTPAAIVTQDEPGYFNSKFTGKKAQEAAVEKIIAERQLIPESHRHREVTWFYDQLGIDDMYFELESNETIADHIESLYGAKIQAHSNHEDYVQIDLKKETDNSVVFIYSSPPDDTADLESREKERQIDELYLDNPTETWRLESYRGKTVSAMGQGDQENIITNVRCIFVSRCQFNNNPTPEAKLDEQEIDSLDPSKINITSLADKTFLKKATNSTLSLYQGLMQEVLTQMGPVAKAVEVQGRRERRIIVGFKDGSTTLFFSALTTLYHAYGLYSTRKYVEHFANGVTIISVYLHQAGGPPIEMSIYQILKEISLIYVFPRNPFFNLQNTLSVQEAAYVYCAWIFAQHFLNRLGPAYQSLKGLLDESNPTHFAVLTQIRARLRGETFTRALIKDTLDQYPQIIRWAYVQFAMAHYYSGEFEKSGGLTPTLSYQRVQNQILSESDLRAEMKRAASSPEDLTILESLLTFNKAALKTNFFTPTKVAVSFRLDPSFLPSEEYPRSVFGLFFVVGAEFRGFHTRFKDVARGGIRIVMSRNREAYSINQRNLFDENYGLAATQALKNKDIPEGGSKGVILPDLSAQPRLCFEKYVDSILDLVLPGKQPGIKEPIIDLYGKPEILFFGPDEGTADMMDWAALHARARGASWWKSFSTGKTAATLGGIPHDKFGMTSLSVRQYETGIYEKLGLDETKVTKVQTGGPDGDLGSNEILLSKDRTITIIDGSGTIHDPEGLDRTELIRLAKERKMINHFDITKLSPQGYRVLVDERDVKLPNGETVEDGAQFRNLAHLRYKADILVPCGGRPESINTNNMSQLWNSDGIPNFKYIVEGANLFITPNARLALEKRGVILFRDSSANKGGVTSSSLEVLVGLSLPDDEFIDLMTNLDGEGFDQFYLDYVRSIQETIILNAKMEFNCIWTQHELSKRPYTLLSDDLSKALLKLQNDLEESDLYDDSTLRVNALSNAIPNVLIEKVGLAGLLERLPDNYKRSLFASYVASHFIYKYGIDASNVDFFHYVSQLKEKRVG